MTDRQKVLLCFAAQQLCLFGGLTICIIMRPAGLHTNNGISYYGVFTDTFPYYSVALLGSAAFSLLTAHFITDLSLKPLKQSLIAIALLLTIITFTPYFISTLLDWIHTIAGIIMFIVQVVLSFWLVARLHWSVEAVTLLVLESVTGILSAMYVVPIHGFLLQAQISFQLAFAALLLYAFMELLPREHLDI
jgi:hypothetical protein